MCLHRGMACVTCQCLRGGHLYGETVDKKMADLLHKVGLMISVNILNIMGGIREGSYKYRKEIRIPELT